MNRLDRSRSPYLRQHAANPVHWWEWGQDAFAEAARLDRPVLLSIGYSACHWCHVMAHESFEDDAIAALMNENFVSIKVDREERPDIDAIYMAATQMLSGQGGWPMTAFLTPAGEPFYCGTYYPPEPRHGQPSFPQVLEAITTAWRDRRDDIVRASGAVLSELSRVSSGLPDGQPITAELLGAATTVVLSDEDRAYGGFGGAPKFPPSLVLEALLRHHERTGLAEPLAAATRTAEAMARGGMYDQLGGGFARYSVDAQWIVPHFEKMLYDNALLLRFYAHLFRRTGSAFAQRVARETAEFVLRDLAVPGGFAAALDADTDGVEGLTYAWTPTQLAEVLGHDGPWAVTAFGITETGTFEHGSSVLQLPPGTDAEADPPRLADVRARLFAARSQRLQPARDDKVITEWNSLMVTALAEAAVALDDPALADAARRTAGMLWDAHMVAGRLRRASLGGVTGEPLALLADYGAFATALLAVHQLGSDGPELTRATDLLDAALELFEDPEAPGSWFDTGADAPSLVVRPRDPADNATPSGAALITEALLTASLLAPLDRAPTYAAAAQRALARASALIGHAPRAAGHWLAVAESALGVGRGPVQVTAPDSGPLLAAAQRYRPGGSVLIIEPGTTSAHICHGEVCDLPLTAPDDLAGALRSRM